MGAAAGFDADAVRFDDQLGDGDSGVGSSGARKGLFDAVSWILCHPNEVEKISWLLTGNE